MWASSLITVPSFRLVHEGKSAEPQMQPIWASVGDVLVKSVWCGSFKLYFLKSSTIAAHMTFWFET